MADRRGFVQSLFATVLLPLLPRTAGAQSSPASVAPAHIAFRNAGTASVVAVWMDFAGAEVIYSTIEPGRSVMQDTYVGHIWRFRRGPGGPIVTQWVVDRPAGTLVVGNSGHNVY